MCLEVCFERHRQPLNSIKHMPKRSTTNIICSILCQVLCERIIDTMLSSFRTGQETCLEARVIEVELGCCTPLVFSTSGGLGPAAKTFYKRLASLKAQSAIQPNLFLASCRIELFCCYVLQSCVFVAQGCHHTIQAHAPHLTLPF